MKGVILAGGTGSRLRPLTHVTNKHLLPIGDWPMLFYPIERLANTDITDIMVITGTEHAGAIFNLLAMGTPWPECEFTYRVQKNPDGIAGALRLAEGFVGRDKFVVILGDNIFDFSLEDARWEFESGEAKCHLFLKETATPERFGVAYVREDGEIYKIVEKPGDVEPPALCVTGVYMYTPEVFSVVKSLIKSGRGEYEISDVNDYYVRLKQATYTVVDPESVWIDAGTLATYHRASKLMWDV